MIHSGEKPFSCNLCDKSYSRAERLKFHMNAHNGKKPFLCNICDKGFTEKSNLKTHMKIHTGERTYLCEYPGCSRSFVTLG